MVSVCPEPASTVNVRLKISSHGAISSGDLTSCLKAFLNPVMDAGAKARPGTQLTTTGSPSAQVPLVFSSAARPSLQLDKWASLPVQLTAKSQYVGFLLRANILDGMEEREGGLVKLFGGDVIDSWIKQTRWWFSTGNTFSYRAYMSQSISSLLSDARLTPLTN